MSQVKKFIDNFGYTRIIIILFLIILFIAALVLELQTKSLITGILNRAGMNMLLTLAMVPSVEWGRALILVCQLAYFAVYWVRCLGLPWT